jgi:phage host-nuclease inhibitor protein Gam
MKLGELYSELTLKDRGFKRGLASAKQQIAATSQSLNRMATVGLKAFAALGAAAAGMMYLTAQQEEAEYGLEAAFDAVGESGRKLIGRFKELASAIQNETTMGDEAIMGAMALAVNMGIATESVEEATKQAIGLAKAYGLDLKMAMRGVALARKGEFTLLNRYIPALRTAANEQAKMAAFTQAAAAGYKQAQAETNTFAGAMKQLKNELGDAAQALGAHFLPYVKSAVTFVRELIPKMITWIKANRDLIVGIGKAVAAFGTFLITLKVITAAMAAFVTLKEVAIKGLAGLATAALAITAAGGAAYMAYRAFDQLEDKINSLTSAKERMNAAMARNPAGTGAALAAEGPAAMLARRGEFLRPGETLEERMAGKRRRPLFRRERPRPEPGFIGGEIKGRPAGFTGIAELAKTIQQNIFARRQEERQRKLLVVNQDQLKALKELIRRAKQQGVGLEIT